MSGAAIGDPGVRVPSLPEIADHRAADNPEGIYLHFLAHGEEESCRLSFGALAVRARSVAAWLRKISLPGDRALLAYPAGPDFAIAFLACLYAGVIAVPVDPPRRRDAAALDRIIENSGAALLLAHSALRDRLADAGPGWLLTDTLEGEPAGGEAFAPPSPDAIAYIQYTSGSTRAPRGAAISYRALAQQLDFYARRAGDGADTLTFVGWLPHTHDFGLVGFLLSALFMGRPYVWMPAGAFLRRPMRWIEAISRYRGSYCGAPAFAYDLCAAAATGQEALDLGCWQIAALGGDYVAPATLARFEAAFAPAGFRSRAWLPAYGLAESVLCATGRNGAAVSVFDAAALRAGRALPATDAEADDDAIALVSSGRPMAGQQLRIVDPDTGMSVRDGVVGEIWLAGASLADGYWNDPAATAAQFGARIAGETEGLYLRTGDCGFVRGGELFVTGRLKDMIIVHGRNHAPEDIEQTIQDADPALRRGAGAVFQTGVEDGARLIAVQEASRESDVEAVFAAINQAVTARHGLALDAIRLLRVGSLPRTRSGKIARGAARAGAAAGTLREHAVWTRAAPRRATQIEAELIARLRTILPGVPMAVDDNLLALGLESLGMQQLIGWLGRRYGVEPPLDAMFGTPTVAGIARIVAEALPRDEAAPVVATEQGEMTLATVLEEVRRLNLLVAEQGRLLAALAGQALQLPQPEPVEPSPDRFTLTEMQQDIRLLGELRPDAASVFHTVMVLELASAPDEMVLRTILRRLGRRHDALRTVFEGGGQRVLAWSEPLLERVVLDDAPEAWLRNERRRAFAPDAPLWRAAIVAAPGIHLLVVTAHHLALDGASLAAFAHEFAMLHADPAAVLSDPVQPRGDSVETASRDHAEWWQGMLGHVLPDWQPPQPLPAMHRIRYDCGRVPVEVDGAMRAALVARGGARGASLFQTLFVAYAVLLHRISRQERVLIGVDTANRGQSDAAMLGCCNLLVPVVADFGLADAVERLPGGLLQSLSRRDYTLSMWARDQRVAADPGRAFKVNATINYQRLPAGAGGVIPRFDLEAAATDESPFGLTLDIRDTGDALRIDLIHNPKFVSSTDAARFARYARRLLDALAQEASPDLLALPLHDAGEAAQLASWSGVGVAAPAYVPLLDRFATQCARAPHAPAIRCTDASFSYAALDAWSDGLAGAIAAHVPPGASVALLARRGCHALAAMLGVWKAGCVYVALDAGAPDARLARLCAQAEVALLLHDGAHDGPDPALPALRIDRPCDVPAPPRPRADSQAPAYLLFTSGSTGEAKAALVSHGGMANHLQAKIDGLGLGHEDCIAQTAGHGFDISLWQYLAPLAVGAAICVLDDAATHDPRALFIEADRAGVTVLQLVPTLLRGGLEHLIRQDGRVPFARLRWLISTGEALAADVCRRWIALYPHVPVVNAYGPTECSDDVTHHIAEWAPPPDAAWVPIGRPIRGAVLHVVDGCGNPVPPGTPGELLVGGVCVGLGYRGDPARSAAAFVPDRLSGNGDARLYRTGDLVRYRADGALDYLGRIDQQIKIGGVRIEPGEIEAALLHDPALLQAYVTTRPRADGTPALIGYVVMRKGKSVDAGTLKAVARNVLPPALVPNAFVFLDALPLTVNGKIDAAALPEPDLRPRPRIPEPPATPVEASLLRIWSEAIGQNGFGVQDDFFDLGGRSLDASHIARKIEEEFGIKFPMSEMFRKSTIRGIAKYVELKI